MTIQQTDIRLGNKLLHKDKVIDIESIYHDYINVLFFEGGHGDAGSLDWEAKLDELSGIPLSKELLLSIEGFKGDTDRCELHITKNILLQFYYDETYYTDGFEPFHIYMCISPDDTKEYEVDSFHYSLNGKIRYLHQLQNLYYFLTGKELIFNATVNLSTIEFVGKLLK